MPFSKAAGFVRRTSLRVPVFCFFFCYGDEKCTVSPWESGRRCPTGRFPHRRKENGASSHVYLLISLRKPWLWLELRIAAGLQSTCLFLASVPKAVFFNSAQNQCEKKKKNMDVLCNLVI